MNIYVLNESFEIIFVLDVYESFIWTERYYQNGDFEILTNVNDVYLNTLKIGYYLMIPESDTVMIIEDIEISSDAEEGNKLLIKGRSLESILDRRVIWTQINLSGNLQDCIQRLLNESIISPSIESRKINNFIFKKNENPYFTDLTIDAQIKLGDNLYDTIQSICESKKIGFKITLNNTNLIFELYFGVDRSYSQSSFPYVIFSPKYDNLINSNYLESIKNFKNVALVGGEGEGNSKKTAIVDDGSTGLKRREIYVEAYGINSDEITSSEYEKQLEQKGKEELLNNKYTKTFDGEFDTDAMFKYNIDFLMGDIVQVVNEYNIESRSRVIELIRSIDVEGINIYPTFENVDNEGDDS